MDFNDKDEKICQPNEQFFANMQVAQDGVTWLAREDQLFLPAQHPETKAWLFQEVTWACGQNAVQFRIAPDMCGEKHEMIVQPGSVLSALPVPTAPGWLQDAATKMFVPMNHPNTGQPLFSQGGAPAVVMVGNLTGVGMMMQRPPGVPPNAVFMHEKYVGNNTLLLGCAGCLICGLPGLVVCCIGCDERDVWVTPEGRKYDVFGKPIEA